MEAMADQFIRLTQLSDNALNEQRKYWEDVFKNAEKGTNEYNLAEGKLKQIIDLQDARAKSQSKETLTTNLDNAGTADIKQSVEWLTKYQSTLKPLSREWRDINALIEAGNNRLKQLSDDVKMEAMADQFIRLTQLSDAALAGQKKYWEDVFRNAEKGTNNYNLAEGKLQQIKKLEQSRLRTEATTTINNALSGYFNKTNEETREAIKLIEEYKKQLATGNVDAIKEADKAITELNRKLDQAKKSEALDVLGDMDNHSTEQIKQAVDWLTKYRSTLATSTQEWKDLGVEIEKANEYMRSTEGADKMAIMEQKLNSIGTVSTSALAELKKYWQEVVDSTEKNNTNLAQYEDNLRRVIEEEKARKAVSADAVMTNLSGSSVTQIREAIKATEELRESVKRSDPQWAQYNTQIENAKNYLERFETEAKKAAALDVVANLDIASTGEMKQTIDFLTKYRDTLSTLDPEYDTITQALEDTTEALKKFNDSVKMDAMNKQMQNLNSLSKTALAEQKKYWQGVYDSAEKTSQAYKDAESNLMKLDLLERSRTSADATQNITEALSGNWDKTIKETEEAIKLIQEYKNQLRTQSDSVLIDQANEAIEALNRNLGKAKEALMDVSEAERIAEEVNIGKFYGTSQDINDAKKSLEEFRKTLSLINDADKVERIDKALASLSISAEQGGKNLKALDEVLNDLSSASMEDLQGAAKRLQEELKKAERNTKEYADTSIKLQRVNKELEKVKKEWEGQESLFIRMTKRLSVYMAAYGSLSAITSYVKDLGKANLQLSDSIADVAKTTGLNAKELAKLGEDIRAIDTRTAQEQLYELAAAAGQLGIKSEAEVAGFVRAANMITVSLNELGTEATTQLMKIATLTGESQDGTEKALLSIGSAINELTASSAAAAGPIVDLMNRMGGIAAQSKITSAQMAAIGATADALGQSVEITGTSMNKFLATLMSNTDQIAYALNMDAKALRSFINEGKTMDAVIAVFERMNDMGGLGKLAPVMGDLGSEGARMTQVLAAMAEKVDFLKVQLEISTEAYEKATSIQNEYNVKNENAIAILQRMGNALKEAFVNNVFVDALTVILRTVYEFFTMLKGISGWAYAITMSITGLTAALLANRLAWVQNLQAVTKLYPHLVRLAIWQSLTSAVKSFTLALLATPKAVATFIASMFKLNTWINLITKGFAGLKVAIKGLWTLIQGNWVTILIGTLTAIGAAIYKAATYVSEAAKATAKYNRELQEETDKVDTLFNSLKRLNSTEADRARTINAINSQYGQYLGFMLDEKDSAEKLVAAHQLINAELRKRMALNLRTTLEGTANNEYAEQLEKSSAGIGKAVENLKVKIDGKDQKERSVTTSEVIRLVTKTINERVAKDTSVSKEQLLGEIKTAMSDAYRRTDVANTGKQYTVEVGADLYEDIEGYLEDLIDSRVEFQKKVALAEDQANVELGQLTNDALEARKNFLKQTESEINEAKNQTANLEKELKAAKTIAAKYDKKDESKEAVTARQNYELKEKELRDHYAKMVDNANDYVEASQKLREDYNESLTKEDKERIDREIKMYQDFARETAKLAPGMDPWDKGRDVKDWREFSEIVTNLDTSSAKALAAAFKKIKDEAALFPDDVQKVYELFQAQGVDEISLEKLGLKDATSVADMVWKWEKQIKDKLETKFHRNTELGFIFRDDSNRSKKTANEMYKEWLAELDAYYNERETIIRQNGIKEGKLETEINRQIEVLTTEKLTMQRELEEGLLSDLYEGSTFDPTKFEGVITKTKYFANLTLEEMRKIVAAGGPKLDAEIRKNMTNRMVKIEEQAYKIKQRINKILLKDDFTGKVAKEYLDSLDELGLLFNIEMESQSDRTKEEGERRLTYMKEWAKEAYLIDSQGLENLIASNDAFSKWRIGRTQEDYEALLVMLRKYHDDMAEAENRAAQRRKRILDKQWSAKPTDNTKVSDGKDKQSVSISKSTSEFISTKVNDKQIKDLKEKISVEKNTIEIIKERTKVEIDAAKESMELAEQELLRAQRDGNATKEQIDNYNSSKKKYEELVASREKYILESSERIAKHEENIQTRILEIRVANSNESQDMEELLQAEIEKEEERVKLVYERMKTELAAAKMSMIIAEQDKNLAERTGENIKKHTDKYIQAKEAYEKLTAEFNNLTKDSVSKIVEYKQIIEVGVPDKKKTRLEAADDKIKGEEADLKMYESARDLGLASERRVEDAQIAVLQARIDKEKEYINFIYERMQAEIDVAEQEKILAKQQYDDLAAQGIEDKEAKEKMLATEQAYQSLLNQRTQITQESGEKIKEYEREIEAVQLQTTQRKMDTLKGYTDAVVSFGEQMGEAAFGEVEDRKEAARQLLKTTLQLTKDLLMAEAQRLIMKKVLGQKEIIQEQTKETAITTNKGSSAITNLTVETAETGGKVALGQAGGAAKIIGELGWWGIPLIAVINAALSALMGAAMSAVSKSKDEIASATGTRKLSTGMLTYAEGNYPVLGNDGKVYDAKYEGAGMKTGVYGGGAHFGIFSEKQPEMIVDGKTTQKIILNYPYIYDAITTIAKNGRLKNAMPTFATGDYPAGMKQLAPIAEVDASTDSNNEQLSIMREELAQSREVNRRLLKAIEGGITAHLDGLETHKQQKKNERFLKRRGID